MATSTLARSSATLLAVHGRLKTSSLSALVTPKGFSTASDDSRRYQRTKSENSVPPQTVADRRRDPTAPRENRFAGNKDRYAAGDRRFDFKQERSGTKGFREDRNSSIGFREDRNDSRGFRGDRAGSLGFREDRNGSFREDRTGSRGFREDRNSSIGFREDRNSSRGFREERNSSRGFREDRNSSFREDRNSSSREDRNGSFREGRNGSRGFREDRNDSRGFREDRNGSFREDRTGSRSLGNRYNEVLDARLGFRARSRRTDSNLRDVADALRGSTSSKDVDEMLAKALQDFEGELKALRVMIKDSDSDPWKAASRIKRPYNTLISLYLEHDRVEQAFHLYNQMKKDGIFPSASTFTVLISGTSRTHVRINRTATIDRDSKSFDRVSSLAEGLQHLWQQAFPRYFRDLDTPMPTKKDMAKEIDNPELSEQERRNLISRQASIMEVQEYPVLLSKALGAYVSFLRRSKQIKECWQLFDRIFPPLYLSPLYADTIKSSSEDADRTLLEMLPVGDATTMTAFMALAQTEAADGTNAPFKALLRIWDTWIKLIQLELRHTQDRQRANKERSFRFVPDETAMQSYLYLVRLTPEANWKGFAFTVADSVYGLDLTKHCDGVLRDPRDPQTRIDSKEYLKPDTIDGSPVVAELRDPITVYRLFRLFDARDAWKERVSLFNFLWMRALEEGACGPEQPFGPSITPTSTVNLLLECSQRANPVATRLLLDTMNESVRQPQGALHTSENPSKFAGETREDRQRRQALSWVPLGAAYHRTLRSIVAAEIRGAEGLAAGEQLDTWKEVKEVYNTWHDSRELQAIAYATSSESSKSRRNPRRNDVRANLEVGEALRSMDAIVSTLLEFARRCRLPPNVLRSALVREALNLVDSTVGLQEMIEQYRNHLRRVRLHNSRASEKDYIDQPKFPGLAEIARALNTALDTEGFSFASASEVQLWKSLKSDIIGLGFVTKFPRNRLLLSRDDHAELEEDDEDEMADQSEEELGPARPWQMRRSQHVEQELDHWVRNT